MNNLWGYVMNYAWRKLSNVPNKAIKKLETRGLPQNDHLLKPYITDFLDRRECETLVRLSAKGTTLSGAMQAGNLRDYRYSQVSWLLPCDATNWIFKKLDALVLRANRLYQYDLLGFLSGIQVASYPSGGHYSWHMDTGTGDTSNRKLSVTVQLSPSTDYTDGDLEFMAYDCPANERELMRRQGVAIVFPSFLNHRVKPVGKGLRRSMVAWVAGPPFR